MSTNINIIHTSYLILTAATPLYQNKWLCDEICFRYYYNAHNYWNRGRNLDFGCWKGFLYGTDLNSLSLFCDIIFSLMRKICYMQNINYKKTRAAKWHGGGVVVHILWSMDQFQCKMFTSHLVECMISFNIQIHLYYEFIYFLQCKINEFIYFCSAK
jgi:hypothetical protein